MPITRRSITLSTLFAPALAASGFGAFSQADQALEGSSIPDGVFRLGTRRELFVDSVLIERLRGLHLQLAVPVDRGVVLHLDRPWEGAFCGYSTVLPTGKGFRVYYRGLPSAGRDGSASEVTCCAESRDGIGWQRPDLGLWAVNGSRRNNVVLGGDAPFSHNFCPFVDQRPGVSEAEQFKAVAGIHRSGLCAFVSPDGLNWRKARPQPIMPPQGANSFDSQNVAFWSASEQCYVLYFRTWKRIGETNFRWVSRATSQNFLDWSPPEEMDFGQAEPEHLYTNQTAPYFRAPHLYAGVCARFLPGRQAISPEQAASLRVDPRYYNDCSDAVLLTSRGGTIYHREFPEAFLRPGVGLSNWVSRSNYPALNVIQTGPAAMSFFVNRNYGQPTACLQRYELRLDGFASLHARHSEGECLTRPLTFDGNQLELNVSTSAAGGLRIELQEPGGAPIPGFTLDDSVECIGDEIERTVTWKRDASVAELAGKPIRVRFVLRDADLYSFRFRRSL